MPAVWPPAIPFDVLAGGFRRGPDPQGRVVSQVDAGKAKMRPRHTAEIAPIDVPVLIASTDLAAFEDFYRDTLAKGTQEFDIVEPERAETLTVRFRPEEQAPYDAQREAGGRFYVVVLKLEIVP